MAIFYETHLLEGSAFPYIFHRDSCITTRRNDAGNWHTNMEILCITAGEGVCTCDAESHAVSVGDLVIIGSNVVHAIAAEGEIHYDCLIVDRDFCKENGLPVDFLSFPAVIHRDGTLLSLFDEVRRAIAKKDAPYPAARVRAALLSFLVPLYEGYCTLRAPEASESTAEQTHYIKEAVAYINAHLTEDITLDTIADRIGISRYYLCRQFKKYVGETVFEYLNVARCKNAHILISRGMSVSSAALSSGFTNLSYFTRTYKKYFGTLPSRAAKKA